MNDAPLGGGEGRVKPGLGAGKDRRVVRLLGGDIVTVEWRWECSVEDHEENVGFTRRRAVLMEGEKERME